MSPHGRYHYTNGYNPPAVIATAIGAAVAMVPVLWTGGPGMHTAAQYSWFIGMGLGFLVYRFLAPRMHVAQRSRIGETADADPVPA
jgi:NCS1 family nucleobase:cation symporter-1